jgi:hypothetical protein
MKHQVVMDVTELDEIKSGQFELGRKKGFAECLAQLEKSLEAPDTRLKGVAPEALVERVLSLSDRIKSAGKIPSQIPQVIIRRGREANV